MANVGENDESETGSGANGGAEEGGDGSGVDDGGDRLTSGMGRDGLIEVVAVAVVVVADAEKVDDGEGD